MKPVYLFTPARRRYLIVEQYLIRHLFTCVIMKRTNCLQTNDDGKSFALSGEIQLGNLVCRAFSTGEFHSETVHAVSRTDRLFCAGQVWVECIDLLTCILIRACNSARLQNACIAAHRHERNSPGMRRTTRNYLADFLDS